MTHILRRILNITTQKRYKIISDDIVFIDNDVKEIIPFMTKIKVRNNEDKMLDIKRYSSAEISNSKITLIFPKFGTERKIKKLRRNVLIFLFYYNYMGR